MRVLALAAAAVLFVGACATSVPSGSPSGATPADGSVASPTPSSTPAPSGPRPSPSIECDDPASFTPRPTLTCASAVAAARAALPADGATVTAIEFSYGIWCPPGASCEATVPDRGFVVFRFVDRAALFVTVLEDRVTGAVSAGEPRPFPPDGGPPLAHHAGDGWSFDHPAAWRFSPVEAVSSFSDSIGYLGTIAVDPNAICQHSANMVSCNARGYDLPPGNVVVLLAHWGTPMVDPVQFYDRPVDGTRVSVAGMPAVLGQEVIAADRVVLTWKIARPDAFGNWIQIDADIHGPGQVAMRAQVDALIASFRFEPPPIPLATGQPAADAAAAKAVAALRASEPAAYACFPDRPGETRDAAVRTLPMLGTMTRPLPVRCSITIEATDIGLWRMELVASWTAADDRTAGTAKTIQWVNPDGSLSASSGGGGELPYCCG